MTNRITRQERVDAAVAIVEANARAALDRHAAGNPESTLERDYIEAYAVAPTLTEQGWLAHDDVDSPVSTARDRARRSLESSAKRLLDEAAAAGRIVRWSTQRDGAAYRLDGTRRPLYANAVGYTTAELLDAARANHAARLARESDERRDFAALLERARLLGLPEPTRSTDTSATYGFEAFRQLVAKVEDYRRWIPAVEYDIPAPPR